MASLISSNGERITVNRQGGLTFSFDARDDQRQLVDISDIPLRFIAGDDLFSVDAVADPRQPLGVMFVITKDQIALLPPLGVPFVVVDADEQGTTQPWHDGRIAPEVE